MNTIQLIRKLKEMGSTSLDLSPGDPIAMQAAIELEKRLNYQMNFSQIIEDNIKERDKEWFQIIESILGFHPISMTEALTKGIEKIKTMKKQIQDNELPKD